LKSILHLDLDTFFVSVERLKNSKLIGKPVLIGGTSDRGVVASCSYEARKFGIHSAMPMKMAKTLCPEAIVMKGNSADYTKHSRIVTDIVQQAVPVLEKASVDEFYADLSGMDKFFGCMKMATELRQRIIKESGLPISFGLSENKTVSKVATGIAKPNNQLMVEYGTERAFLAPLSVKKIPMVGEKTHQKLISLGVRKIQTIQEMPMDLMERAFGKNGVNIWRKANGIDASPVIPYSERKSISTERTFDRDTIDIDKLKGILTAMTENLGFQLRRGAKLSACITIKVRYSDFNTYTLQSRIPYTSADYILIPKAQELFDKLYNRRLLIRLIGVRLSDIVNGCHQIDLFDNQTRALNLYDAMDKIRDKHGDRSVMRVSGMEAKTISRWNPFSGEPPPLLPNRRQ
jgi:DNA polymerase IV